MAPGSWSADPSPHFDTNLFIKIHFRSMKIIIMALFELGMIASVILLWYSEQYDGLNKNPVNDIVDESSEKSSSEETKSWFRDIPQREW